MPRQQIRNRNSAIHGGSSTKIDTGITPGSTFSFGIWLKPDQITTAYESYVESISGGNGFAFAHDNNNRNIYITFANSGVYTTGTFGASRHPMGWAHYVITATTGSVKLYLNGTRINTNALTVPVSGKQIRILTTLLQVTGVSEFVFDNGTIWTAEQVAALYTSGTVPSTAEQVLPLDEGAGSIAYDSSGNGNNGTITSGTWTRDTPTKTRKAVGGNMVFNGDFEIAPVVNVPTTTQFRWIDGTATGNNTPINIFNWGLEALTGTGGAMYDSTEKYSGSYSMKLSTTATGSRVDVSPKANSTFVGTYIPVSPSTSYTATGRIKTAITSGTATTGAKLLAVELTGDQSTIPATNVLATGIVTTQDWTYYTVTFTTAATTRFMRMFLQLRGNDGAATLIGDAWFDDITLTLTTPETRTAAGARLPAVGRIAV